MLKLRRQAGFTLVELLVVIVVITVLAAIAVVSFSGIQQRARNTARIAEADGAIKIVSLYIAGEDDYPFKSGGGRCLGYGFPEDKCWGVDSPSPAVVNAELNKKLEAYGSLPRISGPPVEAADWQGPWRALGPVYHYNAARMTDGKPTPVVVIYFLEGANQDCGRSVIASTDSSEQWSTKTVDNKLVTEKPRYTLTGPGNKGTHCIAPMQTL